MTISSETRKAGPFYGNGVATSFPFGFKVFTKNDFKVLIVDTTGTSTTLTVDSDYSVSLNADQNNDPGGTITYPMVGAPLLPLSTGYSMTVIGDIPNDQQTDITNSGGFYPNVVEDMIDRSTIQIQQIKEKVDRAITVSEAENTAPALPPAAARKNMLLGFDASGNIELFSLPASVGAGDLTNESWTAGTDYIEGVSTAVTLSRAYGSKANLGTVVMAGVAQDPATYALSGSGAQLMFLDGAGNPTPIPVGVTRIWCVGGTTLSIFKPAAGSVDDSAIAWRGILSRQVDSIAALRLLDTTVYNRAFVHGYRSANGVGGGAYRVDASDTLSADNGGTIIVGASGARWKLEAQAGTVTANQFGAYGDGATNDATILNSIGTAVYELVFTPGTYVLSGSVAFNCHVRMMPGAKFQIASGATLTFNLGFTAGVWQAFSVSGTGNVAFNPAYTRFGYPEWWGAKPNDATADCLAAINACIVACPITQLHCADYYTSGPVQLTTPHRRIQGVLAYTNDDGAGNGARIIVKSSTADVVFIGLSVNPGSVNSFLRNTAMAFVQLRRATPPTPPALGAEITAPSGVRMQYTLYCDMEYCSSEEHSIGYLMNGTVRTNLKNCYAFRSVNGTTTTNDIFWGYLQNGNAAIGLAGGNASSYYTDCTAGIGGTPTLTNPIGCLLNNAPVDTFILRLETSGVATPINVTGSGGTFTDQDVHIVGGVFDQFTSTAISLNNLGGYAAVNIMDCYAAPAGTATTSTNGISIVNCTGTISLSGNQIDCQSGPACSGLYVYGSAGVISEGNIYNGSRRPIVLQSSANFVVRDIVNNASVVGAQSAIYADTVARAKIDTVVKGVANAFPQGVWCNGTTVVSSEFCMTGVDAGCIAGGSPNKLIYNNTAITATGAFGGNLAQGIMT